MPKTYYPWGLLNRRDTSPIFDTSDLVKQYDTMNQRVLAMKKYGYEIEEQRKERFLKEGEFAYDPNLTNARLQKLQVDKYGQYMNWYNEQQKKYGYNLPLDVRLQSKQAKNLLRGYQSQLIGSQKLLQSAATQIQQEQGLWDKEYFEQQREKLESGDDAPVSFLRARRGDYGASQQGMLRDLAKDSKRTIESEVGGKRVKIDISDTQSFTQSELSKANRDLYDTDPTAKRDVNERFAGLDAKEQEKYGSPRKWVGNPDSEWMKTATNWRSTQPGGVKPAPLGPVSLRDKIISYNPETKIYNLIGRVKTLPGFKLGKSVLKNVTIASVGQENGKWVATMYAPKFDKSTLERVFPLEGVSSQEKKDNQEMRTIMLQLKPGLDKKPKDPEALREFKIPFEWISTILSDQGYVLEGMEDIKPGQPSLRLDIKNW